jgi:hypothetical protein
MFPKDAATPGVERTRTAVTAPGTDPVYEPRVGAHGSYWAIFTTNDCVVSLHDTKAQAEAWLEHLRVNGYVPELPEARDA